jgi:DNA-binding MarR family transcriptional regulator
MYMHHDMARPSATRMQHLSAHAASECACEGLRRAARAVSRLYEEALAPFALTATQFAILVALHLRGPLPLSRLADRLVLDRTSLYRAVRPLVRRGVVRIAAGRTRRERLGVLTQRGRRVIERALPAWEETQQRFVEALGVRTWSALASTLPEVPPVARALERPTQRGARRRAPRPRAGERWRRRNPDAPRRLTHMHHMPTGGAARASSARAARAMRSLLIFRKRAG